MAEAVRSARSSGSILNRNYTQLWYWEDRVGRLLLRAQSYSRALVPDAIVRDRPLAEFELDSDTDLATSLSLMPF